MFIHLMLLCLVQCALIFGMETPPETIYDIVRKEHTPTITDSPVEPARPVETWQEVNDNILRTELNPSNTQKFERVCTLLAQNIIASGEKSTSDLSLPVRHDLNLFAGHHNNPSECLVNKLNRTKTTVGKATLCGQLLQPITAIPELKAKQRLITNITPHLALLHAKLEDAKSSENGFLSFYEPSPFFQQFLHYHKIRLPGSSISEWLTRREITGTGCELFHAIKRLEDWFNESELLLTAKQAMAPVVQITSIAARYAPAMVAMHELSRRNYRASFAAMLLVLGIEQNGGYSNDFIGLARRVARPLHMGQHQPNIALVVDAGLGGYEEARNLNDAFDFTMSLQTLQAMQNKLYELRKFILALEQVQEMVRTIPAASAIAQELQIPATEEAQRLVSLLKTNTFASKANNSFCHWGRVKIAYKLMLNETLRQKLLIPYAALGLLECIANSAQLLQENPGYLSMPTYIGGNNPLLLAYDYYNPFLDPTTAVKNTIELGRQKNSSRSIIVTGPNGNGKTANTTLAIPLLTLLSQTMCVVTANEFLATPCSQLVTMIKNESNIGGGDSLFQAIARRVGEVRKAVQQNNGLVILAFDEPFGGGTGGKLAEASAYTLIKEMGLIPNTLCVITTHFKAPTTLEKEHPQIFANFKAAEQYKIMRGIGKPDLNTGIKVLEERVDQTFAAQVTERLNTLREGVAIEFAEQVNDHLFSEDEFSDNDLETRPVNPKEETTNAEQAQGHTGTRKRKVILQTA